MLMLAAILLVICGFVHSVLGERYLLRRLFRLDNLPHLFGSDAFTKGTLRFAWHITTFCWFGFAALLLLLPDSTALLLIVGLIFFASGVLSAYYTKGKHLSWLVFFAISALSVGSLVVR